MFNTKTFLCATPGTKLLYYSTPALTFIGGTVVVFFLTKVMQRKLIIFYSLIFVGAFMFLSGPSYVFGLYDNESS